MTMSRLPRAETHRDQIQFHQLYVVSNRLTPESILARVKGAGYRDVFFTVDTAVAGKRETNERYEATSIVRNREK